MRVIIALLITVVVFYLVQLGVFMLLAKLTTDASLSLLLVVPLPGVGAFVLFIAILFGTPLSNIIEKIINPTNPHND
jgi:hypothetical protein